MITASLSSLAVDTSAIAFLIALCSTAVLWNPFVGKSDEHMGEPSLDDPLLFRIAKVRNGVNRMNEAWEPVLKRIRRVAIVVAVVMFSVAVLVR